MLNDPYQLSYGAVGKKTDEYYSTSATLPVRRLDHDQCRPHPHCCCISRTLKGLYQDIKD